MASIRWTGGAQAIAQVDTLTIAGGPWVNGETITMTINGKDLTVTVGDDLSDTEVALLCKEAWEGETLTDTAASYTPAGGGPDIAEFSVITATSAAGVVTLTADTAGVPFVFTETEAGSGTATAATATACTGPNFFDNADNWDGAVPVSTDDVFFDNSDVSLLYELGQSAITLTSLTIGANYTGDIGLPKTNPAGYIEYLTDYLEISATTLTIGRGEGTGSGRIKINTGSTTSVITVHGTGSPAEFGLQAFLWKGSDVANEMEVQSGSVGVAAFGGENATLNTVSVTDGDLFLGDGFAAGSDITNRSGNVSVASNVGILINNAGTTIISGAATVTTLTVTGGQCLYQSSGTATTVTVGGGNSGATIDCSGDGSARTFTNVTLDINGEIFDPLGTVTYTNNIVEGSNVQRISAT